jgi:hypothetical protein
MGSVAGSIENVVAQSEAKNVRAEKPVPTYLKQRRGNPGKRRLNHDEPIPPGELNEARINLPFARGNVGMLAVEYNFCAYRIVQVTTKRRKSRCGADCGSPHVRTLSFSAEHGTQARCVFGDRRALPIIAGKVACVRQHGLRRLSMAGRSARST